MNLDSVMICSNPSPSSPVEETESLLTLSSVMYPLLKTSDLYSPSGSATENVPSEPVMALIVTPSSLVK